MRKPAAALLLAALLLPLLLAGMPPPDPAEGRPENPAWVAPKVVRGPQLTHPDPLVWPTPPFVSIPDPELLVRRTRDATGVARVLVILARFLPNPSTDPVTPRADFEASVNGLGGASMRTYYREVSYGLLDIQATIVDWVNVGSPMSAYGTDSASGTDDANGPVYRLVIDAVRAADASVNFAQFDQDGPGGVPDGMVDHLFLIHAAEAQESSSDPADSARRIWSHRWAVADGDVGLPGDQPLTADGVEVYGYIMASEFSPIGVYVHEFGHDLGLPDLYDTDGSSKGAGAWDVMATGSWNGPLGGRGSVPAHFSAWSKAKLGWILPDTVTDARLGVAVESLASNANGSAYKLPVSQGGGADEYFLVEYRNTVGFDAELPAAGLLIWHVDDARADNSDDTHRLLDLEEADDRENGDSPEQDTDVWVSSEEGFTPDSVPNSNGYGNLPTGWKVLRIGAPGTTITVDMARTVLDDLAVVALDKPSGVRLNAEVLVTATVSNGGARPQSNVAVELAIYRGVFQPDARISTLRATILQMARGENRTVSWTFRPDAYGNYILRVNVLLEDDELPENNDRMSHVGVFDFLVRQDWEGSETNWSIASTGGDFLWRRVAAGETYYAAFSPTHAYRFGWFGGGTNASEAYLVSPFFTATPFTYVAWQQRYSLTGQIVANSTVPPETDEAFVQFSVDLGPWQDLRGPSGAPLQYVGTALTWSKAYANLTAQGVTAGSLVRLRWGLYGQNQTLDGGWWLDDIFVVTQNLTYGMAVRATPDFSLIDPGGFATYRLKVTNVGDFPDTYRFNTSQPTGWATFMRLDASGLEPVSDFSMDLGTDQETAATLIVQAPENERRGTLAKIVVRATSENDRRQWNEFPVYAEVYDPSGLGRLLLYLPLFIIFLIVMAVIAAVIRKVKEH